MNLSQVISNPLYNDDIIRTLIEQYVDSDIIFYNRLIHYNNIDTMEKDLIETDIKKHNDSMDAFYAFIFNKFKNNIVADKTNPLVIPKDQYEMLQNFLRQIPDISSYRELADLRVYLQNTNPTQSYLLEKLLGEWWGGNTWQQMDSYIINLNFISPIVEHRLYVNADYANIFDIMTLFIKKCDQYNIPYSFKYNEEAFRDDNIVIYASSLYLEKYVQILREIKKELQLNEFKKPPLLTGLIDGWIGYGSEPLDKSESFSEKRADIVLEAIQKCIDEWLISYAKVTIYYNGEKLNIRDLSRKSPNIGKIILQNDGSFISRVRNEIISICNKYGIDSGNFAFDLENKKRLNSVETAINYFRKDVSLKVLPGLSKTGYTFFFQNGNLNIICVNEFTVVNQVWEKLKKHFPNIDPNQIMIYDINQIQDQELIFCNNAIILNNEANESNYGRDRLYIIGENITKCGCGNLTSYQSENTNSRTK